MREFLTLVAAIYIADCLFEISRLVLKAITMKKPRRDARGRFVKAEHRGLRRVA